VKINPDLAVFLATVLGAAFGFFLRGWWDRLERRL
jgi:hypothetical protein